MTPREADAVKQLRTRTGAPIADCLEAWRQVQANKMERPSGDRDLLESNVSAHARFPANRGGSSPPSADLAPEAKEIMVMMQARGAAVPIPEDVVCGKAFAADTPATAKASKAVEDDDLILDIGPRTAARYAAMLAGVGTIVWNGPVGVFEFAAFENGTRAVAEAIAASPAFSIAGGGDTLAAIAKFGVTDRIGYISTGGGAFLEFLEGKKLPAVEILESRAAGLPKA